MEKQIRIGMFGAWRGNNYIDLILAADPAKIKLVAICDKQADKLEQIKGAEDAKFYADFDTFLSEGKSMGMNAVFLANYFYQHTPFAIRAMEAGMDVVSECTSSSTLKECVELVRCVERTGRKYMIAENYPFSTQNMIMDNIVKGGTLGTILYCEGEYNHSGPVEDLKNLTPFPAHWRAWLPRTYYVTHAMGPLMYMTDSMPKYVSARAAHSRLLEKINDYRKNDDGMARMFCEMDNGMTASFTGCTAMASDYSRYRICGDLGSCEQGGYTDNKVRVWYYPHTKPADEPNAIKYIDPDPALISEEAVKAANAGHGGGDYWIVQNMISYFLEDKTPFFDVYKGVAMSATAILGWRSCLNHGENYRIPDFRDENDRKAYENDDLTPFVDENLEGQTLPASLYQWKK